METNRRKWLKQIGLGGSKYLAEHKALTLAGGRATVLNINFRTINRQEK
jgi:hypothetical protein